MSPYRGQGRARNQLKEKTTQDVITPQVGPAARVSSLTHLHKSSSTLRVCLDPKDLNKAIICKHHKAPTLEEITHRLTGSTTGGSHLTNTLKICGNLSGLSDIWLIQLNKLPCATTCMKGFHNNDIMGIPLT